MHLIWMLKPVAADNRRKSYSKFYSGASAHHRTIRCVGLVGCACGKYQPALANATRPSRRDK